LRTAGQTVTESEVAERRLSALAWTGLVALVAAGPCAAADVAQAGIRNKPDWLREQTRAGLADDEVAGRMGADSLQLVVQQDCRDGTDLLTLRYPLVAMGNVSAYAGAGLNQAVYFADTSEPGPTYLSHGNRHRSLGAAAELGAAWKVGQRMMMSADLRWVDLAPQANMLRTPDGLVAADEVSVGVSLGWRFR
jgi:hypothetical protein